MLSYRIECESDDGSWSAHEFESINDDVALSHALRLLTHNRCELYQADRWLATFDRAPRSQNNRLAPATDNTAVSGARDVRGQPSDSVEHCRA